MRTLCSNIMTTENRSLWEEVAQWPLAFMGPLAASSSGFQALAAGCPCLGQLCFFINLNDFWFSFIKSGLIYLLNIDLGLVEDVGCIYQMVC